MTLPVEERYGTARERHVWQAVAVLGPDRITGIAKNGIFHPLPLNKAALFS